MLEGISKARKDSLINIYLFFVLYLALIAIEKQLLRTDLVAIKLPFQPGPLVILAGFIGGSVLILLLTHYLGEKQKILRGLLITILLFGAILGNRQISLKIFYPPFDKLPAGNLEKLGKKNWQHDYPYGALSTAYDMYYLQRVLVNPDLIELEELSRVYRFGVNLVESPAVSGSLTEAQLNNIEVQYGSNYQAYSNDGIEYRLYDAEPDEDIFLVPVGDLVLFIPAESIMEDK